MGTYIIPTEIMIDAKDAVYRSERYAISGAINKKPRGSWFYNGKFVMFDGSFGTGTTANMVEALNEKYYFKSLDKIVSTIDTTINFPTAPTGTNLITNGTFDTDTAGWINTFETFVVSSGVANISATAFKTISQDNKLVIGKKYVLEYSLSSYTSGTIDMWVGGSWTQGLPHNVGYNRYEFVAQHTTFSFGTINGLEASIDNIAVFAATDLLCYDNLLLKDDGTYIITQTEQNQYITMDTMLDYTSTVYNVTTGVSTGTSLTFTYDMVNEEYSGSDGHKYLTIGATARFNQGAYHPVFNAYGTKFIQDTTNSTYQMTWYATSAKQVLNTSSAFSIDYVTQSAAGTIALGYSQRPDNKLYDIIYNELWIDQRWRAEWVDGTKERTTIERDKDISASQYADFVGSATWETVQATVTNSGATTNVETNKYLAYIEIGSRIKFSSGGWATVVGTHSTYGNCFYVYPAVTLSLNETILVSKQSNLRYGSTTFIHTDIIGNPSNYPQVWKDALAGGGSIAGTPLLVGENGEDYTGDNEYSIYKLSKKANNDYGVIGYASSTFTYMTKVSSYVSATTTQNSYYPDGTNYPTATNANTINRGLNSGVAIINYQAYNNNLAPIVNSKVVGGSSDVYVSNWYNVDNGCLANAKLINKISTNNIGQKSITGRSLTTITIGLHGAITPDLVFFDAPEHTVIALAGSLSPAVKLFSYLTNATTRHKQCYVFKEMKYDATGVNQDGTPTNTWGDDNKFNIVSDGGVNTTIDNNGNAILVGNKARLVDYRVKE